MRNLTVSEVADSNSENEKESNFEEEIAVQQTLRKSATPDVVQQPLCIQFPDIEVAFELKSGFIHLLPIVCGFAGEDPQKHLKEFHVIWSTMKSQGVTEEQIKLRAFPFSLGD